MKKKRGAGRNQPERSSLDAKRLSKQFRPSNIAAPATPANPVTKAATQPAGRLYTQCPQCKTVYRISVAQLRAGRGEAHCQECQAGFSVLDSLADTAVRAKTEPTPACQVLLGRLDDASTNAPEHAESLVPSSFAGLGQIRDEQTDPLETSPTLSRRIAWGIGSLMLLALVGFQIGLFKGPELAQNDRLRPWLETACETLGCRLPDFHAPRLIQILSHDLHAAPDGIDGYEFTLVLANQASSPQAFPAIKLILAAYNGSPAAARVFEPAEYLPETSPALMPVGERVEIHLLLAKPEREIGGFSFELL